MDLQVPWAHVAEPAAVEDDLRPPPAARRAARLPRAGHTRRHVESLSRDHVRRAMTDFVDRALSPDRPPRWRGGAHRFGRSNPCRPTAAGIIAVRRSAVQTAASRNVPAGVNG